VVVDPYHVASVEIPSWRRLLHEEEELHRPRPFLLVLFRIVPWYTVLVDAPIPYS
jgi:hypothetical protein